MSGYQPAGVHLFECEQETGRHCFLTGGSLKAKGIDPANGDSAALLIDPDFLTVDGAMRAAIRQKELEVTAAAFLRDDDVIGQGRHQNGVWSIEIQHLLHLS